MIRQSRELILSPRLIKRMNTNNNPKRHIVVVRPTPCLIMVFLPAKLHAIHVICAYFNLLYSQRSWQSMISIENFTLLKLLHCPSITVYRLTFWYFMITTVRFHRKFFSKVDKMICNSFLNTCSIYLHLNCLYNGTFLTKYIIQTSYTSSIASS